MEKQMKKNKGIKSKIIKGVAGTLMVVSVLNSTSGCAVDEQYDVTAEELENIDLYDDQFGILVNRDNPISEEDMKNIELVETANIYGKTVYLQKDALKAFQELQSALKEDGYEIGINEGFRSYEDQENIYNELVAEHDKDYADNYSAPVGYSEHHTGLAIDVFIDRTKFFGKQIPLSINPEYIQTRNKMYSIMADYGFILRYPENKEHITGYPEEEWHIRFVGKELAQLITRKNITLEEYWETMNTYKNGINESEPEMEN